MITFHAKQAASYLKKYAKTKDKKDLDEAKHNVKSTVREARRSCDSIRDAIVTPLLSPGARERVIHGVAPFMWWDYGSYIHLIAESLRNAAKYRHGHMIRWDQYADGALCFDDETDLLNKWADILTADSELSDEPYYKEYFDYLSGYKMVKNSDGTYSMLKPRESERMDQFRLEKTQQGEAIVNLASDVLAEIGRNYQYMWD